MLRSPAVLATVAGTLALGLLQGCAKSEKVDTPLAATVSYNHEITLADFSFTAPDTLPAGWTTFKAKNTAQQLHHATLVRIDSSHTVEELVAAMQNPGPPPAWMSVLGGPQQESEVTVDLTPGHYAWICLIPGADKVPHFMKGMVKGFVVVPATGAGPTEPKADVEIAAKDYTWTLSAPITAGEHMLKIHTEPGQPHEMVILRVTAGKTSKDVLEWMEKMQGPPPVETVQGVSALQPGVVQYEKMNFTPGHYAIICFVPDAKDGKAHFMHGMTQDFDVK